MTTIHLLPENRGFFIEETFLPKNDIDLSHLFLNWKLCPKQGIGKYVLVFLLLNFYSTHFREVVNGFCFFRKSLKSWSLPLSCICMNSLFLTVIFLTLLMSKIA